MSTTVASCSDTWAAGLFEGEGCVLLNGRSPRLIVQMQDPDPIRRLHAIYPWTHYREYQPKREGLKLQYVWETSGWPKTIKLMDLWLPWLGSRRRRKWEEILAHQPPPKEYGPDCGLTKPCSTAGAQRHYNKGEKPCRACVEARSEYSKLHGHWEK